MLKSWLLLGCLVLSWPLHSAEPLPDPLTLEYALSLVDAEHPELAMARAQWDEAAAEAALVDSRDNVQALLEGRLRYVEPSADSSLAGGHDDHMVGLAVRKRLWDAGRTRASLAAALAEQQSRARLFADAKAQRRIDIMEAFFRVLLADLRYTRDNEAMAAEYVQFDRMRDRFEQGLISDIDLLEAETLYQQERRARYASDVQRRIAREHLANLLNRPGQPSANLQPPDLPQLNRPVPELERLTDLAMANNHRLQALRAQVAAADARIRASKAVGRPSVDGSVEFYEFTRELGSRDNVRAGITLQVPLYTGGAVDARVAKSRADWRYAHARLTETEMDLRQALLELTQEIYVLKAQLDQARVISDYRDLYLDRSRALYELDVRTDLGDSMTEIMAARLFTRETQYELALAWARLEALIGQSLPLDPSAAEQGDSPS